MNNLSVENDKRLGKIEEKRFSDFLIEKGFSDVTISTGDFPDWDVVGICPTNQRTISFEVKKDFIAPDTGRFAVEITHVSRLSGLSRTKADFYVYTVPTNSNFYITQTQALKTVFDNKEFDRLLWGGDDGKTQIMLINKAKFESICRIVTP